jgi:transcriptional regulator with XRE-family HTH domain
MKLTILMDLKELRLKTGLSAEAVAASLGKSHSTVRNWEAGNTVPTMTAEEFIKICELYRCSLETIAKAVKETNDLKNKGAHT